jgi:hypothetical protein
MGRVIRAREIRPGGGGGAPAAKAPDPPFGAGRDNVLDRRSEKYNALNGVFDPAFTKT